MRSDKHTSKRKWPKVVGIIVLLLFLGGGAYAYSIYHSLNKTVETMNEEIDRPKSEKRTEEVEFNKKHPFSVLLLGVDERAGDRGRSDTMIVVTVNPQEKTTKMLSIPRDTRVEIVGKGIDDKINHAYAFGGVEMSMDTVEQFLDIPIDYYAKINMEGFKDIVNAVGGVTVNNDFAFTYSGHTFNEGALSLNGDEALLYSRMRKQDPRGDFGRQARQRQVIQAVIKEGASVSSLWNYGDIFEAIGDNVKTNLTLDEMVEIQKNYKDATKDIKQSQIAGSGAMINNGSQDIYYYIVPEEERQKVQEELKSHLNLQ
ncbi:polyisoprenyl-teichoic acid--peptidoglycan teichoic acid transferase TagU [Bacillus sp. KH172YL63]|uniref:polyisoprenyl-teichoic acid--peptidoglycan teichoic acid transferase TagU n=1 Tax=Bacillus sp. KH172YL63 TaxID=2709784 RepID=UPI0013E508EC|nr:LytR family transcriptional regulator [Bacillus sp. KH172YL63]BCB05879.1 transcriptional regulator LytR [Bacillus sp. KH172YL63]